VICIKTVEYIRKLLPSIVSFERLYNSLIKKLESTGTVSWKPTDTDIGKGRRKLNRRIIYREVIYCQKNLSDWANILIESTKLFVYNCCIYLYFFVLSLFCAKY
jgi:hypothetical protein